MACDRSHQRLPVEPDTPLNHSVRQSTPLVSRCGDAPSRTRRPLRCPITMRPMAVATRRSACETRTRRIPKRAYVIRLMSRHRPSLASLGRYVPYTTRDSQFAQCLIRCWRARQPRQRHYLFRRASFGCSGPSRVGSPAGCVEAATSTVMATIWPVRRGRVACSDALVASMPRFRSAGRGTRDLVRIPTRSALLVMGQRSSCPRCWWRLRCRRRPVGRSQITDGALRQTSSDRTSPPGGGPAVFVQRPFLDRMPRPSDGCNATTCLV